MTSDAGTGDGAVVVVGEALVDAHLSPGVLRLHPGGGPFNTAIALAALGVPARFAGAISRDRLGEELRSRLADAGVDTSAVVDVDAPTPIAVVATDRVEPAYSFYLAGTAHERLDAAAIGQHTGGASALHVGTLALLTDPPGTAVAAFAEQEAARLPLIVDPNVRPSLVSDRNTYIRRLERLVAVAELVKLSEADLAWVYPGSDAAAAAQRLLGIGAGCVVITFGGEGAAAWTRATSARAPAPRVEVVDTVGAGDAFGAGLLAWLWRAGRLRKGALPRLDRAELEAGLRYAAAAGAAQCTRASAWGPASADVERLLVECSCANDTREEERAWQPSSSNG